MKHLDEISLEKLHETLEAVEGKQPTKRLLTAIAYKNGITQTELAEWNDTDRRTIYNWLMRLDTDGPLTEAVTNNQKSGRKRKLSGNKLQDMKQTIRNTPQKAGYDVPVWTTKLVRHHLEKTCGVKYSIPSCRRLLKEAGLSYQNPGCQNEKTDREGQEELGRSGKNCAAGWTLQ